jgi:hypothetical protein
MRANMKVCGMQIRVSGRFLRTARLDADRYQFIEGDPESVLDELRQSDGRIDLFTFLQRLPDTAPRFSYPMKWDNFAAITIPSFDDWWMKQLGFKARNKAKQAEKKGVVIREVPFDDDLVRGIWGIYNECPVRQGRPFRHYGKSLETVYREEATYLDSSIFIGAYLQGRLIGFIKMVMNQTQTQAGLMNIVSLIEERDKAPSNALIAQAVRVCASQGIPYLVYSKFAYGKKQRDSLSDFKERNGFQRIEVPRYYVPLTPLGSAALRFGLHEGLGERIPEPVAEKLRQIRQAWYSRRFPSLTEAS